MADNAANVIRRSFVYRLDQDGSIINNRSRIRKNAYMTEGQGSFREALKGAEILDLQESISQQEAEAAGNLNKYPGIDPEEIKNAEIADFFSNFSRPEPTGDPETDKILELLYDFYESCFDTTHSGEFLTLTRSLDLTGMTNAEKYKAIYEKYQYCYGENFLDIKALQYGGYSERGLGRDPYWCVYLNFCHEIEQACGSKTEIEKARIEALYGEGLRPDQVCEKIVEKYYYEGMTLRDLLKMTHEMWNCGLDGGVSNLIDEIIINRIPFGADFSNFQYVDEKIRIMDREKILDEEVSKELLLRMQYLYNNRKEKGISLHPDLGVIIEEFIELFKVNETEGGVSADNDIFANVWDKFK